LWRGHVDEKFEHNPAESTRKRIPLQFAWIPAADNPGYPFLLPQQAKSEVGENKLAASLLVSEYDHKDLREPKMAPYNPYSTVASRSGIDL